MQNLSVLTMKPLGQQLVDAGLLTDAQLQDALAQQKSQPDKLLGQVLVESGLLSASEFDRFMQARMAIQQPLGELLVQRQAITREQLHRALSVQMQSGASTKPLGQLLVEQGAIDQDALDQIIQQQYAEQEALREQMTRSGQAQGNFERSQIEDIQHLLSSGQLFLSLAQELLPESERGFAERFEQLARSYGGPRGELSPTLQNVAAHFMEHFLPVLEMGFQLENQPDDELEARNQIVNLGFHALLEGFQRILLPEMRLSPNFYLNSLILTEAGDMISLREALYVVMRSPYLMPHGSLMALRFLLNEFWGQRSILEQRGVQIVRHEDEIDLSDFFRPRMEDLDDDLRYVEHMENHLFNQIEYAAETLRNCPHEELEVRLDELVDLYRVLLQTHCDWKQTRTGGEEA
ncbi:MAG: hypothetical protein ACO1RX_23110 [Candidatus Sericytochromatia bacterium]